ncbi:ImuA family protein [Tistrella bauzanensis]
MPPIRPFSIVATTTTPAVLPAAAGLPAAGWRVRPARPVMRRLPGDDRVSGTGGGRLPPAPMLADLARMVTEAKAGSCLQHSEDAMPRADRLASPRSIPQTRDPGIRVRPSRLLAAAAMATAEAALRETDPRAVDDAPVDDVPVDEAFVNETLAKGGRPATRPDKIAQLKATIARIEGQTTPARLPSGHNNNPAVRVISTGCDQIDGLLGDGGLALGRLHEIITAEAGDYPAAGTAHGTGLGLAALWAATVAGGHQGADQGIGSGGPVLWVGGWPAPYAPGLADFGLDPARLLVVPARRSAERLWVMEEAIRSGAVAAVVGEVADVDPLATRRLQLAAAEGGGMVLLIRPVAHSLLRPAPAMQPGGMTATIRQPCSPVCRPAPPPAAGPSPRRPPPRHPGRPPPVTGPGRSAGCTGSWTCCARAAACPRG